MSWCNFRHFSVQTAQLSSDLWPWGCLLKTRTWRFRNNPMSAKIKPSLPLKQVLEMSLRLCTSSLVSYLPLSTILEHFFFNLSKLRLFLYSNSSHLCHHSPCLQWCCLSRSFFCTLALALILPENKILKKFRNYLRPTSVAIYTLKETSSDLGLKRWNEPTVPSEKMVLDLAKSVKEWPRYGRF